MMDFIIYDAKAAVILAVFYMFYRLLLSRETFHRLNRVVLLITAVGAMFLPLWQITFHRIVEVEAQPTFQMSEVTLPIVQSELPTTPWWQITLITLFIIGAVAVLIQTLFSVYRVVKIISSGEKKALSDGITLVITQKDVSPFSWMQTIVMSQRDYETDHAAILSHERAHIQLHHSWDLLLVDLVSSLQWFNPAIWMLRADLCAVHEYEADAQVLNEGYNAKQYQYLLVKKAVGMSGYSVANSFNHRELKSRITMMCRKKSSQGRVLRALYLLPLVGVCLAVNAKTEVSYMEKQASPSDKVTDVSQILQETGILNSLTDTLKLEKVKLTVALKESSKEQNSKEDDGKVKIKMVKEGDVEVIDPLVIVDGKRVDDINDVDPNTIKSVQVLKAEAAIAQYGEEGKNGVIIVKTKGDETSASVIRLSVVQDSVLYILNGERVKYEQVTKLNAEDIKHIRVLKGEEAIKNYGEAGQNGVMIIETKEAEVGLVKVEADTILVTQTKEHWVDADGNDVQSYSK